MNEFIFHLLLKITWSTVNTLRKFVNARSPLRLLEKGLHGGLGIGNLGLVLAGRGVGKTPFLVGVALDEGLRGGRVLHVALDQTVARDDIDRLSEKARSEGSLIQGPTDYGPPVGYWAFLRDPDGHTLEVSHGQEVALAVKTTRA